MLNIKLVLLLCIAYVDCEWDDPPPVFPIDSLLEGFPGEPVIREEIVENSREVETEMEESSQTETSPQPESSPQPQSSPQPESSPQPQSSPQPESDETCLKSRKPEQGWFSPSTCYQYRLTDEARTWNESREWCKSQGGDLVTMGMRNASLARTIYDGLPTKGLPEHGQAWIGLSDIEKEGTYVWVDGVQGTSSNLDWGKNQPDDYQGQEDCGEISTRLSHQINDFTCNSKLQGICEKPL